DIRARVLADEHLVACLDVERPKGAVLHELAVADGDHLRLERLLFCGVRDEQAASGLLLLLETLGEDSIMKRTNLHDLAPLLFARWVQRGDRLTIARVLSIGGVECQKKLELSLNYKYL